MGKVKTFYLTIEKLIYYIAYIALFLIMVSITIDATARTLFNSPIQGTYEVVGIYFMVMVVFLGLGYSFKNDEHVRIKILYQYFPEKVKLIANITGYLLSIILFSIIAIEGFEMTYDAWINENYTFGIVSLPVYLSYIWVPIGTFLLVVRLCTQVILNVGELVNPTKVGSK